MTDTCTPVRRFYGVVLNYDAVYHRRELVAATSIPEALQLAAEQADTGDWDCYGEPGPTYVERFQAFDTDDEAIAYLNDRASLGSDTAPYALMGQGEQIEELQRTIEILEGHKQELQAKVESLQSALRCLREAVYVVEMRGGVFQELTTNHRDPQPTIVVVDWDESDRTIDGYGSAAVHRAHIGVSGDFVGAVMAATAAKAVT